jgi:hypothetical protein
MNRTKATVVLGCVLGGGFLALAGVPAVIARDTQPPAAQPGGQPGAQPGGQPGDREGLPAGRR